jgi:hypothetical protein
MAQFMSASIIQFVSTNLTNHFEQIGVDAHVPSAATVADTNAEPPPPKRYKRVDPLELRQLKMLRWTTKVDSIGARLESEFDGVTSCTSIVNSDESKVGLLDSGWSSLKYAWRR